MTLAGLGEKKKPFPAGNGFWVNNAEFLTCRSLRWYYPDQVPRVYSQAHIATPSIENIYPII
jgi:hypothetical protein